MFSSVFSIKYFTMSVNAPLLAFTYNKYNTLAPSSVETGCGKYSLWTAFRFLSFFRTHLSVASKGSVLITSEPLKVELAVDC